MNVFGKVTAIGSMLVTVAFAAQGCAVGPVESDEEAEIGGESADSDENVAQTQDALGTCLAKVTCGAGKVCGAWSAYAECGVSSCNPGSESCVIPGRGGGPSGSTTHVKQRTRACTMPGGASCTEVQLSYTEVCDCG